MSLYMVLEFIFVVLVSYYIYLKWVYGYWKRKKFPCANKFYFFGSFKNPAFDDELYVHQLNRHYNYACENNMKCLGLYILSRPLCLIIDPEIVKNVLIRNFDCFSSRGFYYNEEDDPLSANLISLTFEKWKPLRTKLSPTFSPGKMKLMFQILLTCGSQLKNAVEKITNSGNLIDVKNEMDNYTTNVIGSCAFGLDCNTFENPDSDFKKYSQRVFLFTVWGYLKFLFCTSFPHLAKKMKITMLDKESANFFKQILADTIKYRESNGVIRNDLVHMLVQLQKFETISDSASEDKRPLTFEELSAQALLFFIAGFETSANTATFCLYELALNLEIQQKVRQEICKVLKKHQGNITYESINELKYMEQVLNETLRKYPPVTVLNRESNADFDCGDCGTIEKGTMVIIPVYSLQHDPNHFPEPEKFDPERFNDENKKSVIPYTYLPFGDGPRNCLGYKFAYLQIKVGLTLLLRDYKFSISEKSEIPIILHPRSLTLNAHNGVWLKIEKLDN